VAYNVLDSYSKIKYAAYTKFGDVKKDYPDYLTNDIDVNGIWSEPLPKLQEGNSGGYSTGMFQ
jgi:hypothetical protein